MTVTLAKLRGRVRNRLRDADGRMANPSGIEVDMALADAYIALQADLPSPTVYTANAFTISANSDTFTLPVSIASSGYGTGTVEYAGQVEIQLVSIGQFLRKRSLEELNAFKNGQPTTLYSIPHDYALYQDRDNVVRGRTYPGAKANELCNLFSSITADDLRDYVGAGSSGMDDVSVNLGRYGAAALVGYTAGLLAQRMTGEVLQERGINPAAIDAWMKEAMELLYHEGATRNALESSGRTQRWVP